MTYWQKRASIELDAIVVFATGACTGPASVIRNFKVEHYKSIVDASLKLKHVNVLVGANSSGKSNVLDALTFVRDCMRSSFDHAVSERHGIDSVLQWSPYRPFNLLLDVSVRGSTGKGRWSIKISSRNKEPVILEEHAEWTDRESGSVSGYARTPKSLVFRGFTGQRGSRVNFDPFWDRNDVFLRSARTLPFQESRFMQRLFLELREIELYNIFPNVIRTPQKPSNDARLSSSGDNITSILKSMTSSGSGRVRNRYQEIVSLMKQVIPNLDRIIVRSTAGLSWLVFEVEEKDGRRHQFNVSQISDGALRILGIVTALYQPNPPRVLAIEEPEQNIHPGLLGLLADSFKETAETTQVFVTTHSPHFIDHFEVESLFSVDMSDGITRLGPIARHQRRAVTDRLITAGEIMTVQGFEADLT